ncbi:MAG: HEAT repeat domain-containing protein, partial [Anaerolineae bacterium]|nr:HEAT repeat domain-containing protein [Anaerolineae bacterium]
RTTALLSMALRSAGFLDFPEEMDVVQQQLEAQEARLSRDEQAARIKQRVATMERARQQYTAERGETVDGGKLLGDTSADRAAIQQNAPVYIHLADLQFNSREFGRRVDPAEPLVRGLQKQVGRIVSMRMVQRMYNLLESGNALLLIDGYDDLPENERPAAMDWIESILQTYSNNHIVIAMPLYGYGRLIDAGVVPVFLRPWNHAKRLDFAQHWMNTWENFGRGKLKIDPMQFEDETAFHMHIAEETRLQNALDSTLHTWTILDDSPANQGGAMQAYLLERLPEAEEILPDLLFMAATQLDTGYFKLSHLVARALEAEGLRALPDEEENPEIQEDADADDSILDAYYDEVAGVRETPTKTEDEISVAESPAELSAADEKITRQRQREITREQSQHLQKLVDAGILAVYRGGRYQFRHKMLCAYLGSLLLAEADEGVLHEKYQLPDWQYALRYANLHRDLTPLVIEQIQATPDLLHEHVLSLTHWLRYVGEGARWRNEFMKYIGGLFVAEDQYTVVRERVAAALLYSGDRSATVIFRHALKNPMSDVRVLGCLGVGVLQDAAAIDALAKLVIEDAVEDVRIAAALGL